MQFWSVAQQPHANPKDCNDEQHDGCQHHGPCADRKYPVVWYVPVHRESSGRRGDCGGTGRFYANAMRSCNSGTLGGRLPDDADL